eukprot:TRINITY_DN3976_c0_g2_i1.p1 TRINITY_DN3976_c0_g2~~TRINITY_DN3976_c0_g2_i1.p1  ORF type:complete len:486 (+),score=113.91 TRINITY_DN3976_c0_g2_i1:229-1686(+)
MATHIMHSHFPVWVATIEANVPRGEDRYVVSMQDRVVSVMDGHAGSLAVDYVEKNLLETFRHQLTAANGDVSKAFVQSYADLDRQMKETLDLSDKNMYSGTCINTIYLDTHERKLYVANLGDCRSVIARVVSESQDQLKYEAIAMSSDHNCYNPEEKKTTILRSGDRNAIRCSPQDIRAGNSKAIPRVAGFLAVTRSLGDFYLKDPEIAKRAQLRYCPYLTCEPDVKVFTIDQSMEFLVLASDGLWEHMSSKDVVEFLGPIVHDLRKAIFEEDHDDNVWRPRRQSVSGEDPTIDAQLVLEAIQSPPTAVGAEEGRRLIERLQIDPLMREIQGPACTPMSVQLESSESSLCASPLASTSAEGTPPTIDRKTLESIGTAPLDLEQVSSKLSEQPHPEHGRKDSSREGDENQHTAASAMHERPFRIARKLRKDVDLSTLPNPSALLLDEVLRRISVKSHSSVSMLKSLPPGARRYLFDDTTIVVLLLA